MHHAVVVLAIAVGTSCSQSVVDRAPDGQGPLSGAPLQQKGGEQETGPYDLVRGWPQKFVRPGYAMGSNPAIFADTPNRVIIGIRGELELPDNVPPVSGHIVFDGSWGSMNIGPAGQTGVTPEFRNCIVVVDGEGKFVESWSQWDHLWAGRCAPHKIKINPLDPVRHVWIISDARHQVFKFSNDGKELVLTLGEAGVSGADENHFTSPQDVAWLPDGSILVADQRNARVVKFDRTGKFLMSFGGGKGKNAGELSDDVHGVEVGRNGRVYVADRGNSQIQVFEKDGRHIDTWPNIRFPNHMIVTPDEHVWVTDGETGKVLKYNSEGRLLYSWGVRGVFAGAHQEFHQMSVDFEGNLYTADSHAGRAQKFRPRAGADRSQLIAPMPRLSSGR